MNDLIIDAYNFIHAVPELEKVIDKNLEKSRVALIRYFEIVLEKVKSVRSVTLVFDGASQHVFTEKHHSRITVVFTETEEDADDKILELLKSRKIARPCVISNDNYVLNNVKALGVEMNKVEDFVRKVHKEYGGLDSKVLAPEEKLSSSEKDEINAEYSKYLGLE